MESLEQLKSRLEANWKQFQANFQKILSLSPIEAREIFGKYFIGAAIAAGAALAPVVIDAANKISKELEKKKK